MNVAVARICRCAVARQACAGDAGIRTGWAGDTGARSKCLAVPQHGSKPPPESSLRPLFCETSTVTLQHVIPLHCSGMAAHAKGTHM